MALFVEPAFVLGIEWHDITVFLRSAESPGHQTDDFALSLHFVSS